MSNEKPTPDPLHLDRPEGSMPLKSPLSDAIFLTIKEAAKALRARPNTVRRLVREKKIPHLRVGRFIRIDSADLRKWIEENTVNPPEVVLRIKPENLDDLDKVVRRIKASMQEEEKKAADTKDKP